MVANMPAAAFHMPAERKDERDKRICGAASQPTQPAQPYRGQLRAPQGPLKRTPPRRSRPGGGLLPPGASFLFFIYGVLFSTE